MEAKLIVERLGEPREAFITDYQILSVSGKSVAWYTIKTHWAKRDTPTVKKQRFSIIQEALLLVKDKRDRLKLSVHLPVLPLSILPGTAKATCDQRATEFNSFLAAALANAHLRFTPALILLLAPDDAVLDSTEQEELSRDAALVLSQSRGATEASAELSGGRWSLDNRADVNAPTQPIQGALSAEADTRAVEGRHLATTKGFSVPSPVTRYPYRTNEAALVAPTDAMDRMQELLRKAEAAVLALSEAVAERDRAICEKDAFIARISGQLAELRALQDQ